jgi:hypothetical protein
MPMTNAERQKKYRDNLIQKLGIDGYKAFHAEKCRDCRHKREDKKEENKVLIQYPLDVVEVPLLPPIKKKVKPINKSNLKDNTINIYTNLIKKLYKKYTNNDLPDDCDIINCINSKPFKFKNIKTQFNFLFNDDTLMDIIKSYNKYVHIIYSIFTRVHGFASIVKKLYPYVKIENEQYEVNRSKRVIHDDVLAISLNPDDIIAKFAEVDISNSNKLIVFLLLLIPTRRLHDYRLTKISQSIPDDTFDKSFNYYFDKNIYIYNTKNSKKDVISIPDVIVPLIDTTQEFLFGRLYDASPLSNKFTNVMEKVYKLRIPPSLVRIMYATYLRNLNLSGNEWEKQANKMGHGLAENIKYSVAKKD